MSERINATAKHWHRMRPEQTAEVAATFHRHGIELEEQWAGTIARSVRWLRAKRTKASALAFLEKARSELGLHFYVAAPGIVYFARSPLNADNHRAGIRVWVNS